MRALIIAISTISVTIGCFSNREDPVVGFSTETAAPVESNASPGGIPITINAHKKCIYGVSFSPNKKEVATCSMDETLRIWDTETGQYLRGFRTPQSVLSLAYSPDGKILLAATMDQGIHAWDTANWQCNVVGRAADQPQAIAFSSDGTIIALGSSPIEIFRVSDWKSIGKLRGHEAGGDSLSFSPDGKTLVSGAADGTAKVWDIAKNRQIVSVNHDHWVGSVGVEPGGQEFATTSFARDSDSQKAEISFFSLASGKVSRRLHGVSFRGHSHGNSRLAFSPDGAHFATIFSAENQVGELRGENTTWEKYAEVCLWDLQKGSILARCTANKDVRELAFSSDSSQFAIADIYGKLEIWNVNSFIREHSIEPMEGSKPIAE